MASNEAVLTVAEATQLLRVSRPTVLAAVHSGKLPHLRLGRRVLIPRAALERMLAGEPTTQPRDVA